MSFDPHADLNLLLADYDRILALRLREHSRLRLVAAAVSAWSAEQQLAHVALANELVLRNLNNLAKGSGLLVSAGGEAVPGALDLLKRGVLPRGQAQSPRMVRPPEEIDPQLFDSWLNDARSGYQALRPEQWTDLSLKIPHQILGPLDAQQWLRFALVHTRHHLRIAHEVLQAVGAQGLESIEPLRPLT